MALITWGIKTNGLDSSVLITPNALVITKEVKSTAYGTRDASREKTNVTKTSMTVKDAGLSAQEARMKKRWDKTAIGYERTIAARLVIAADSKIELMMYDPAMVVLGISETAAYDVALIAYEHNARIMYIIEDTMVNKQK